MATRLADLDALFDPGLVLTVRGREYTVPLASAETGMWCRRMALATGEITAASTPEEMQAAIERINAIPGNDDDLTLPERTLGPVYAQMAADGVPDVWITYAGATAYMWIISDEETAAKWWRSGGRPEAVRPGNRAERRAATRAGGTGGGAASGIRTPASTSGTRSRRRSGRRRASG